MKQFIEEAEKAGIASEAIKGMLLRDIEEKKATDKKIKWIKIRQQISIGINSIILLFLGFIVWMVIQNNNTAVQSLRTSDDVMKAFMITITKIDSAQ